MEPPSLQIVRWMVKCKPVRRISVLKFFRSNVYQQTRPPQESSVSSELTNLITQELLAVGDEV